MELHLKILSLCKCLSIFSNIGRHRIFPSIAQSASPFKSFCENFVNLIQRDLLLSRLLLRLFDWTYVTPQPNLKPFCDSRMTTDVAKQSIQQDSWKNLANCIQKNYSTVSQISFSPLPLYKYSKAPSTRPFSRKDPFQLNEMKSNTACFTFSLFTFYNRKAI